jgi:hypothetical protein
MPTATCLRMGNEDVPLWLIDEAHPHPAQLVEHALIRICDGRGDLYPGIRAETPLAYRGWLHGLLTPILKAQTIQILRASFAVTTCDPANLLAIQRIPHFDTVDARSWLPFIICASHLTRAPAFIATAQPASKPSRLTEQQPGRALWQRMPCITACPWRAITLAILQVCADRHGGSTLQPAGALSCQLPALWGHRSNVVTACTP